MISAPDGRTADVLFVAMPWGALDQPSLALGLLKAQLAQVGIPSDVAYLNLLFADVIGLETYEATKNRNVMASEWVFAGHVDASSPVEPYLDHLRKRGTSVEETALWARVRAKSGEYLRRCLESVRWADYKVVGFTTSMMQTVASLALARLLKERHPHLTIVLGGANCEGDMGAALHRLFHFVDVVVRGEPDEIVGALFGRILRDEPLDDLPGVCSRRGGNVVIGPPARPVMDLSKNPVPDYDDYFSQVRIRDYAASLHTMVMFESSRGCWWGERSHCTFCALNALGMRYRSKPVPQVIDELRSLRDRYGIVNFGASDNILDRDSIDGLARELTEHLPGITIFYDIRASVSREQMKALKRAGIIELEAGLENLSTPVLRRMAKATTGILNVRFLRRCAEFGIGLLWNYLYGFPGETIEEYEAVVPSIDPWLFHLHPPDVAFPVSLQRFAPYHSDPAKHNISITGPLPDYRYIHPSIDPRDLDDLAYYFEFSYLNRYDPTETARLVGRVVERWRAAYATGELRLEAAVSGDGVVTIRDSRSGTERIHRLIGATALLYRLCESPVSVDELSRATLHLAPAAYLESRGSIHLILEKLTENGLLFREGDRFVAVAVPSGEFWLDLAKALPKGTHAPRPVAEAS